jgi:hypothetical protein
MNVAHDAQSTNSAAELPVVFIAGATGFLGSILLSNLVDLGFEVHGLTRQKDFSREQKDRSFTHRDMVLINCMGITPGSAHYTSDEYDEGNVKPLNLIFDRYGTQIKKFVHCSTWLTELSEKDDYAYSKAKAEKLVTEASADYGFDKVILRLPTIWSKKKYKHPSLLYDLFCFEGAISEFQPKNSGAKVEIGTEEFFVKSVVESILSNSGLDKSIDNEKWQGTVEDLIANLSQFTDENQCGHVISRFSQILKHWKVVTGNL